MKRPRPALAKATRPTPRPVASAGVVTPITRVALVDALRGVAITMMIAYHVCFDLTYFHWADWAMLDDPRWIAWRSAIVTSFLFVAGVSLALRDDRERRRGAAWFDRAFLRRWAQIAAAALLVTLGSAALFLDRYIYFGVLHFVAVAVWLARRAPRLGSWALLLGVLAIVLGTTVSHPFFDPRWIDWIGFATRKPDTEDYVPLFPWIGVVLLGCGVGALWGRHAFAMSPAVARIGRLVPRPLRRLLTTMGRWSLTIYLLHQPLLMGTMAAIRQLA